MIGAKLNLSTPNFQYASNMDNKSAPLSSKIVEVMFIYLDAPHFQSTHKPYCIHSHPLSNHCIFQSPQD